MTREEQSGLGMEQSGSQGDGPIVSVFVEISDDAMQVDLSGWSEPGLDPTQVRQAVIQALREKGVKHGLDAMILRETIEQLAAGRRLSKVTIGRGTPPNPGRDARVDILCAPPLPPMGARDDQGQVEMSYSGPQPTVDPGTRVALLVPGAPGQPGLDVLGREVAPPSYRRLALRSGPAGGVELEEGGALLVASSKGVLHRLDEETFQVMEVLEISGDVDPERGHVDFPGLVRVSGSVQNNMRIKAGALEAQALEPGSQVDVAADLFVRRGIMGTRIRAGALVSCRFIHDSDVYAGGDVLANLEIIQSKVVSHGWVEVVSSEGRVTNCTVSAVKGVRVAEISSFGTSPTRIKVGISPELEQSWHEMRCELKANKSENERLTGFLADQQEELSATEDELRELVASVRDPGQQEAKDNLMAQINMMKPLRDGLKEDIAESRVKLERSLLRGQRLGAKLESQEEFLRPGSAMIQVMVRAGANVALSGRYASMFLERPYEAFMAREVTVAGGKGGRSVYTFEMIPWKNYLASLEE